MTTTTTPPLLTPAIEELMRAPSTVAHVASRDAALRSHLTHACGCLGNVASGRVTIGLARGAGAAVIADVRATGAVAVVLCDIRNFYTIQLKGSDARIEEADAGLKSHALEHHKRFLKVASSLRYSADVMDAHLGMDPEELVALSFTVANAFIQTPGPGTGGPLATSTAKEGAR